MLIEIPKDGRGVYVNGAKLGLRERMIVRSLHAFCLTHPCMGARAASGTGGLFASILPDMTTVESAFYLLSDVNDYFEKSDENDMLKKSLAIAFYAQPVFSQDEFALLYWNFVQTLHDIDCQKSSWDDSVSSDINDHNFELSLCGRAMFTTTLNPQNERFSRRFSYPVWVCNQKSQFDFLRATGKFSSWQNAIRKMDSETDPSGMPNPILVDHGDGSAAPQLAGSSPGKIEFTARITEGDRSGAKAGILARAEKEDCAKDVIEAISRM